MTAPTKEKARSAKSQRKVVKASRGQDSPPLSLTDAHPPTPHPPGRALDLECLRDVRLELAHVYRQLDAELLQDHQAKARCYVLHTIYQVLASGLEKRVEAMEKAMRASGYRLPDSEAVRA